MCTEIGSIAMSLRQNGSRVREVKRKPDGKAKPHRYAQAWSLTAADAVGHFLGVNVGTPLQKKLARLAILLFGVAVVCAIIVLAANNFSNNSEVIIYAVATGLSMIPASLTVVLTITMAAGTKRMVKRHVIVRNLKSLEALGGVTDICSDKTGTLTQGKMVAKKVWIPARGTYSVGQSDEPHNPTVGDMSFNRKQPRHIDPDIDEKTETYEVLIKDNPHLVDFLKVASLANLANVHQTAEGQWNARGDPTEIAIQVLASRFKWNRLDYTGGDSPAWKQLAEFPFDSDVKKMSVIFEEAAGSKKFVFTKGAVERVIYSCTHVFNDESETAVNLDDDYREEILANMESLAAMGLRVLAFASKIYDGPSPSKGEDLDRESIENGLTFRGLVGLYDPPRPETAGSVRQCQKAGIEVHMLTGDHPGTARAIAIEVGIVPSNMNVLPKETADAMVMTASQFDKLSDDEIDALPLLPLVIARCAPNTKVRMIDALHRRKAFTGMTGDGVNDSPSLKRSDVGIGMGTGSDVARQVHAMNTIKTPC
jgi:Na+-exporting ATPase